MTGGLGLLTTGIDPAFDKVLQEYAASEDIRCLDSALVIARSLNSAAVGTTQRHWASLAIAVVLLLRGQRTGAASDLSEAIERVRAMRADGRLSPIDDAAVRVALSGAILERGRQLDPRDYLEEVLELTSKPPIGTPPTILVPLANYRGAALLMRYELHRDTDDLDKAVKLLRKYHTASTVPNLRSALSNNLAGALLIEYSRSSDERILQEALALTADAVTTLRQKHQDHRIDIFVARAMCARSEALCIRWRYERNTADLDEAFELMDLVLDQLDEASPAHGEALLTAASVCDEMAVEYEDMEMLDIALGFYSQAMDEMAEDTAVHRYAVIGAANLLSARFEIAGDPDDVDVALDLMHDAARGNTAPMVRAVFDHNVAVMLFDRYLAREQPGDLDEAIAMHERALRGLSNVMERDLMLMRAAAAYCVRYRRSGQEQDMVRSKALLSAAAHAPRSAVGALRAAKLLADVASEVSDWATCVEAAELAMDGIESVLGALDLARWSEWLDLAQGLVALGGIAALRLDDLPRAISLIERGCGVMAAARISKQRTSLNQARAAGHGALVDAYERAAAQARKTLLRRHLQSGGQLIDVKTPMIEMPMQDAVDALRNLSNCRAALTQVADGLSTAADLSELLAFVVETGDELIYLITTGIGGASFHLRPPATPGGPPTLAGVLLPGLTAEMVSELAVRIHAPADGPMNPDEQEEAQAERVRTAVVGPSTTEVTDVVDQLATALGPVPKSWRGLPRLVAVGELSLLPIEAACRATPDQAVSVGVAGSGLIHMTAHRNESRVRSATGLLAVSNPQPCHWLGEELPSLLSADDEAAFLASRFGAEVRSGNDATAATLRAALEGEALAVLHIGAHGWTSEDDPDLVNLLLADGPDGSSQSIAIDDLPTDLRCQSVFLACCWLARTAVRMPDEAIGFPTTLIQAGVGRVVAPLWPVDDYSAYCFVLAYYEHLLGSGAPARVAVARARNELHRRAAADPDLLDFERAELRSTADAFVLIGS